MSYQWIIDNAESITVVSKAVVARTQSRDGTVRQVARDGAVWQFEVSLASGIPWDTSRRYLEAAEASYNQSANTLVGLYATGQASWLSKYQGNSANYTGFQASWSQGATSITLTTSPSTGVGFYKFRAGDFIQLTSSGKVYKVAADVAYNSNTVTLNRAIIDSSGSGTLQVGPNVLWDVYCTQLPNLSLVGRNQVGFSSSYIFTEKLQ
jgi:hypothetical protein